MATQATIEELINYYVGLLIIQYANKPKAKAHIDLIVRAILAEAIYLDVLNGYDLETAVGVQLDIIGKYVGVTRYYGEIDLENYFGLTDYAEVNPDADPKFGLCTYATYEGFSYNGTLTYNSIVTVQNALSDDDFRILIKLAIIQNTSNHSTGDIDDRLYELFGDQIRLEVLVTKKIYYFFTTAITPLLQAIIIKKLLPKPIGVRLTYVQQNSGNMFAFIGYDGIQQPHGNGMTDYADYDTTSGIVLTYDQITAGA
jgi:hypothetical protein